MTVYSSVGTAAPTAARWTTHATLSWRRPPSVRLSVPQSATVSPVGGHTDRPRRRVPIRTPTSLSHAARLSNRASLAGRNVTVRAWVTTPSSRSKLGGASPCAKTRPETIAAVMGYAFGPGNGGSR